MLLYVVTAEQHPAALSTAPVLASCSVLVALGCD